jgi:pimeloyl-ACP methyl ester carboxylesterase
MKHIQSVRRIRPLAYNGTKVVFMHGYGCRLWQAKRLLSLLQNEGYEVLAIDFKKILADARPEAFEEMINEADQLVSEFTSGGDKFIFVGVSIGALTSYNLMKRHPEYKNMLIVTGGDIRHLTERVFLRKKWAHVPKTEIDKYWADINIYDHKEQLSGKKLYMLLPKRDKIIDPEKVLDVWEDLKTRNETYIVRTNGGHYRSGIAYTIFQPKKLLKIMHEYFGL